MTTPYFGYQAKAKTKDEKGDMVERLSGWLLIGSPSEIRNTLEHYRKRSMTDERGESAEILMPEDSDLVELESIAITCALPIAHMDHFIDAVVEPGVTFNVNANAIDWVKSQASDYERRKRGDLYKFTPGVELLGLYFLPEHVMKSLKNYDWTQHDAQIKEWLGQRRRVIEEGQRRGIGVAISE